MSNRLPVATMAKKLYIDGYRWDFLEREIKSPICVPFPETKEVPFHVAIENSVFFDIQIACDILEEQRPNPEDILKMEKDIFSSDLRLPFPWCWMEFTVGDVPFAFVLGQPERKKGFVIFEVQLEEDKSFVSFGRLAWIFNEKGKPLEIIGHEFYENKTGVGIEQYEKLFKVWCFHALFSLGLINCKNVETPKTGKVHIKRSGRQKRLGTSPKTIEYHTIQLPGKGSINTGQGSSSTSVATKLHKVRGHFKTFTDEKPLLGQHVGTYWWGWQVRGSVDLGEVISDYKFKEIKSEQ